MNTKNTQEEKLVSNSTLLGIRKPNGQLLKGVKLNPNGRPVGSKNLATQLEEAMKRVANDKGEDYDTLLIKRVLKKAIELGDNKMIELIFDRRLGKAPQSIDVTTKGETINPETKQKVDEAIDDYLKDK